jgi:hypothetical protein
MRSTGKKRTVLIAASVAAVTGAAITAHRAGASPQVGDVFVISMENHNFTQPNGNVGALTTIQQIKNNPNAPFQNALINGTASAVINGNTVNISAQTAYANNYYNVLSTPSGSNPSIHPSEPNYLWSEGGTNFGVLNDNTPFAATNPSNQNTNYHLTGFLQSAGIPWKSYQEDIDLVPTSGSVNQPASNSLTSVVAPQAQWTVPLTNFSGTNPSGLTNASNGSHQYDYGAKHNPQVFFTDTNGGNNGTNTNPLSQNYAPLQQLQTDLTNNTVARYNWITPNQHNDSHTALTGGYMPSFSASTLTGDSAAIAQGDDFLKKIIPQIMASQAYQNNGAIVIWWDETEAQATGDTQNDTNHTLEEIVISPLAKPNVAGVPYASNVAMTHSSDLRTMQELFNVGSNNSALTGGVFLNDANNGNDMSDLFVAGAIPQAAPTNLVPEPASLALVPLVAMTFLARRRRSGTRQS